MYHLRCATLLAVMCVSGAAHAATIDFETVPGATPFEGLEISDQFEATAGVTFSLSTGNAPVLADVGGARTAFQGFGGGNDAVAPGEDVGSFFLTDDGLTSGLSAPTLIVTYSQATQFASGEILDIDFGEVFTITAFDAAVGGNVLETIEISASDPDTGNGVATNWSIDRGSADILRIEFLGERTTSGFFGLGFDNFDSGVALAAVPVPAGAPLLAGALGLLLAVRRRQA